MTINRAGVLIVGGGVAGLSLSLRLAYSGVNVTLISKDTLSEGSSLYAQGGIAAVLDKEDSFASHIEDTLTAGAELCDREAVSFIVENAPNAINWLVKNGVEFTVIDGPEYDGEDSHYHLTREGGHSHRRVIHAQDATGREIATTLEKLVRAESRIQVLEHHIAVDLITAQKLEMPDPDCVVGVYVLDTKAGRVSTISATSVVLATGGASKAYLYTSNPDTSTGDGIAMAWRAGCRIANMEFIQFHPTCLYHPHAKSSLISEAVRGEGGHLLLANGTRFMKQHHELEELAPRDIVARAIDYEMKLHGLDSVFLDISHKPKEFVLEHFPNIYKNCMQYGFDISKEPVPVVPAAHYTCGGVITDLNGRTDLKGLYCIGESACTGLHGANRLASNSLLECLVLAESCASHIADNLWKDDKQHAIPDWDESRVTDPDERIVVSHNWDELRRFMWDYVGVVRTDKRLERAAHRINLLKDEIRDYYSNFKISNDLLELRNLVTIAELVVRCALKRRESRGLHYTLDCQDTKEIARDSVIVPNNYQADSDSIRWH